MKIDWPAAATANPGVGVPPSPVLAGIGNVFTGAPADRSPVAQVLDDRPIVAAVSPQHEPIDGVTFETWVTVEVGTGIDRIAPAGYDAYAEQLGAPPGAYTAAASSGLPGRGPIGGSARRSARPATPNASAVGDRDQRCR